MARSNAKLVAERSKEDMTYFKTDLDINKLRERPRNQKSEIANLQAYIDCDLSHKAAQVLSAAWTDKNGVVLAVYFADRILGHRHNLGQSAPRPSQAASSHPLDSHAPIGAKVVSPLLFCIFYTVLSLPPVKSKRPVAEQYKGRTAADLDAARRRKESIVRDGLQVFLRRSFVQAVR